MRKTADSTIHRFVDEMQELYERERRESPTTMRGEVLYGRPHQVIGSDYASRLRRLSAIRAAQLEARDVVVLEAHVDAESLARRLQGLRDRLPAIVFESRSSAIAA